MLLFFSPSPSPFRFSLLLQETPRQASLLVLVAHSATCWSGTSTRHTAARATLAAGWCFCAPQLLFWGLFVPYAFGLHDFLRLVRWFIANNLFVVCHLAFSPGFGIVTGYTGWLESKTRQKVALGCTSGRAAASLAEGRPAHHKCIIFASCTSVVN